MGVTSKLIWKTATESHTVMVNFCRGYRVTGILSSVVTQLQAVLDGHRL